MKSKTPRPHPSDERLREQLTYLKMPFMRQHFEELSAEAIRKKWPPVEYLKALVEGEADLRNTKGIARRVKQAQFPVFKSLEEFDFTWPKSINRVQVQDLFRLKFVERKANVILLGQVGLGKTHLSIALGHAACEHGYRVLFTTAVDAINALSAAQMAGRLTQELKKYNRPDVLVIDEVGYLPVDKRGADLLFQVVSRRYERGSIVLTTNKEYKKWAEIFNNDATLTSAMLDRLLHHSETVVITGKTKRRNSRNDE